MDNETIAKLRTKPSLIQRLKPRKTICKECPHGYEVKTKSCHIGDFEMFCLEEPHICHSKRDGLCRGVVEKMIMNDVSWEVVD
mgnify:FL=1